MLYNFARLCTSEVNQLVIALVPLVSTLLVLVLTTFIVDTLREPPPLIRVSGISLVMRVCSVYATRFQLRKMQVPLAQHFFPLTLSSSRDTGMAVHHACNTHHAKAKGAVRLQAHMYSMYQS